MNDLEHTTNQYRMKGIKQDVVEIRARELNDQSDDAIWKLYEDLYRGVEIEFDLRSGSSPCFDMKHNFSVGTKDAFIKKGSMRLRSRRLVSKLFFEIRDRRWGEKSGGKIMMGQRQSYILGLTWKN
jgi:hypothetical protein